MKNDLYSIYSGLDDLLYRLENSVKLVDFAHIAFTQGDNAPQKEDFEALYSIYDMQADLCKELRQHIDDLSAVVQEARASAK